MKLVVFLCNKTLLGKRILIENSQVENNIYKNDGISYSAVVILPRCFSTQADY